MSTDDRKTAADEIFQIKEQLTDNTYITVMNLLSNKGTAPSFDRIKYVKLKRHVLIYDQKYKRRNGRSIPLEYHYENMDITIETLLLEVVDDPSKPINHYQNQIDRQWLQHVLYQIYTKTCDCGNCYYLYDTTPSGKHYIWRPVELEIIYWY